jgi:Arc/MetJ-type ribon-helix-helix transcriptional regulator
MVKVLVELSSEMQAKIEELIKQGRAKDLHSFIRVAIENQLRWEETSEVQVVTAKNTATLYRRPTVSKSALMPVPPEDRLEGSLLWGQYSRFLPLKAVVRMILNLSEEIYLHDIIPVIMESAIELRRRLSKKDKELRLPRGEQLAIAFPESTEKSKLRFAHQYVGYVRNDGRIMGFGAQMKFINIINNRIGVTEFGAKFAELENPILDKEDYSNPLSKEEVQFLLNHIRQHVRGEAEHILWIVRGLSERSMTRSQLNEYMRGFYASNNFKWMWYDSGKEWSDELVETMRAGLTSRLIEMRIIKTIKVGHSVLYSLKPENEVMLEQWLATTNVKGV